MTSGGLYERDAAAVAAIEKLRFFPLAVERGEGSFLIEPGGRRVLDMSASWGAASLGHGHPLVVDAVSRATAEMAAASTLSSANEPAVALAERLLELTPGSGERRVWLGHSGADANEAALRAIGAARGRSAAVVFEGSYHGCTIGSMALTAHSAMDSGDEPAVALPFPDQDASDGGAATLDRLDRVMAGPEGASIGAVFVEAIQSDAGVKVPPEGFLAGLKDCCEAHDLLLVCDEVKVGLGRSGRLHAFSRAGIEPDLITFGKGLGAGLPLSAVVGPAAVLDCQTAFAIPTTGGNPICATVGLAVLDAIEDLALVANAERMGELLKVGLVDLATVHPLIREVRGSGLAIGVELGTDEGPAAREAAALIYRCWELGVVLYYVGESSNVLEMTPPLTLSGSEVDQTLQVLHQALGELAAGQVDMDAAAVFSGW
jgi:4-aminobutyrate aminotransferase